MGPKSLSTIVRINLILAGIMVAVAALVSTRAMFLGVAVGAALSCANFWSIQKLIRTSLQAASRRRAAFQMLLMVKMAVLIVLVFLAMRYLPISPIGLAIGLSVFLFSIAIESVRFALGQKAEDGRA